MNSYTYLIAISIYIVSMTLIGLIIRKYEHEVRTFVWFVTRGFWSKK